MPEEMITPAEVIEKMNEGWALLKFEVEYDPQGTAGFVLCGLHNSIELPLTTALMLMDGWLVERRFTFNHGTQKEYSIWTLQN